MFNVGLQLQVPEASGFISVLALSLPLSLYFCRTASLDSLHLTVLPALIHCHHTGAQLM